MGLHMKIYFYQPKWKKILKVERQAIDFLFGLMMSSLLYFKDISPKGKLWGTVPLDNQDNHGTHFWHRRNWKTKS